ncbi:hypothetical protein EMN47_12575 [Prolixibacteraceae bacterium JC049]|nr:hypothetical protein [Prolixibacteraceae bacterium JC049]
MKQMKRFLFTLMLVAAFFVAKSQEDSISTFRNLMHLDMMSSMEPDAQMGSFKYECEQLLKAPSLNQHLGLDFNFAGTSIDLHPFALTGNFYSPDPFSAISTWKIDGAALFKLSEKSTIGVIGWHEHTLRTPYILDKAPSMQGMSFFVGHKFSKKFRIGASFSITKGYGTMGNWSNPQHSVRW